MPYVPNKGSVPRIATVTLAVVSLAALAATSASADTPPPPNGAPSDSSASFPTTRSPRRASTGSRSCDSGLARRPAFAPDLRLVADRARAAGTTSASTTGSSPTPPAPTSPSSRCCFALPASAAANGDHRQPAEAVRRSRPLRRRARSAVRPERHVLVPESERSEAAHSLLADLERAEPEGLLGAGSQREAVREAAQGRGQADQGARTPMRRSSPPECPRARSASR